MCSNKALNVPATKNEHLYLSPLLTERFATECHSEWHHSSFTYGWSQVQWFSSCCSKHLSIMKHFTTASSLILPNSPLMNNSYTWCYISRALNKPVTIRLLLLSPCIINDQGNPKRWIWDQYSRHWHFMQLFFYRHFKFVS